LHLLLKRQLLAFPLHERKDEGAYEAPSFGVSKKEKSDKGRHSFPKPRRCPDGKRGRGAIKRITSPYVHISEEGKRHLVPAREKKRVRHDSGLPKGEIRS